jgi:hypothetical protein
MGWSNPEQFLAPLNTQQQIPPEVQKAMEELKILKQEADSKTMVAQAAVQEAQIEGQARLMDSQTKQMLAQAKLAETQGKKALATSLGMPSIPRQSLLMLKRAGRIFI